MCSLQTLSPSRLRNNHRESRRRRRRPLQKKSCVLPPTSAAEENDAGKALFSSPPKSISDLKSWLLREEEVAGSYDDAFQYVYVLGTQYRGHLVKGTERSL